MSFLGKKGCNITLLTCTYRARLFEANQRVVRNILVSFEKILTNGNQQDISPAYKNWIGQYIESKT